MAPMIWHYRKQIDAQVTVCGRRLDGRVMSTVIPRDVTCKNCLNTFGRGPAVPRLSEEQKAALNRGRPS